MSIALFIKAKDLKRHSIMDGNVDADKFMQYIHLAQKIHIRNYLGEDLYDRLQAGIIASDLSADETTLINDYIQDALIHFAAAEYYQFGAYTVSNKGILKNVADNSEAVAKLEIDSLVQKERDYAQYFTQRLIDYLCTNSSLYAEYSTNTENQIKPDKIVDFTGGWYL